MAAFKLTFPRLGDDYPSPVIAHVYTTNNRQSFVRVVSDPTASLPTSLPAAPAKELDLSIQAEAQAGHTPRTLLIVRLYIVQRSHWNQPVVVQNGYAWAYLHAGEAHYELPVKTMQNLTELPLDRGVSLTLDFEEPVAASDIYENGPKLEGMSVEKIMVAYRSQLAGLQPSIPILEITRFEKYVLLDRMIPAWAYFHGSEEQPVTDAWLDRNLEITAMAVTGHCPETTQDAVEALAAIKSEAGRMRAIQWFVQRLHDYRHDSRLINGKDVPVESFDYLPATGSGDCEDTIDLALHYLRHLQSGRLQRRHPKLTPLIALARTYTPYGSLSDLAGLEEAHMTMLCRLKNHVVPLDGIVPMVSLLGTPQEQTAFLKLTKEFKSHLHSTSKFHSRVETYAGQGSYEETRLTVAWLFPPDKTPCVPIHEKQKIYGVNRAALNAPDVSFRHVTSEYDALLVPHLRLRHPWVTLDAHGPSPTKVYESGEKSDNPFLNIVILPTGWDFKDRRKVSFETLSFTSLQAATGVNLTYVSHTVYFLEDLSGRMMVRCEFEP